LIDCVALYIRALVTKLHEKHVPVYLISGGFRCIIEPIAAHLKISMTNVFANVLLYDTAGSVTFWVSFSSGCF